MDYFRTDCIKSYFELVALVNKGNRVINEQTEVLFFILDAKLYLGIDSRQKILLCERANHWYPKRTSGHEPLEKLICGVLNTNRIVSGDVNRLIKNDLFKLPD